MKKLRRLTSITFLLVSGLLLAGGWFLTPPAKRAELTEQATRFVSAVASTTEAQSATDVPSPAAAQETAAGNELVHQSRMRLMQHHGLWTADVLQILQTPDHTYRATGQVTQASGGRCRFEMQMDIGGVTGKLLQVSDGQMIWMVHESQLPAAASRNVKTASTSRMTPLPDHEQIVDRINLQRIVQETRDMNLDPQSPQIARELFAGLTGLLATLEAEMNFRMLRQVKLNGDVYVVVEGVWKDSAPTGQLAGQPGGEHAPDRVRLYLRKDDLFPIRYICLKQKPNSTGWYTPLALELSNIREQTSVDPQLFRYPATDQIPNDITHQVIARIQQSLAPQTADASASVIE